MREADVMTGRAMKRPFEEPRAAPGGANLAVVKRAACHSSVRTRHLIPLPRLGWAWIAAAALCAVGYSTILAAAILNQFINGGG